MPRAHWLDQPYFSDQIAVIEPSERRLEEMLSQARRTGGYDLDVVNDLYKGMCMVLPNEYDFSVESCGRQTMQPTWETQRRESKRSGKLSED
ncbi:g1558 [Coccomyxa elongata]